MTSDNTNTAKTDETNVNDTNPLDSTADATTAMEVDSNTTKSRPTSPTSAAVLAYLKKRGLGTAILELTQSLKQEEKKRTKLENEEIIKDIEIDNDRARDARTALTTSTGGGIGYDLDGAPNVISFGQFGNDKSDTVKWEEKRGRLEGKLYIECFTTFLTYVLSLPSTHESGIVLPKVEDIMKKMEEQDIFWKELSSSVLTNLQSIQLHSSQETSNTTKHELFNLSFPLYVHIYCELLELGLEHDASSFLNAFLCIFLPQYTKELLDLKKCNKTQKIVELNTAILQNSEGQSEIRVLTNKIDSLKNEENNEQIQSYKKKITQHKIMMENNFKSVLSHYPFLKRARSLKWEIRLSTSSMDVLQKFFNYNHIDLLCLNTLLQCRCHVMIMDDTTKESFIPSCIIFNEDGVDNEKYKVNWAAPLHPNNRSAIMDGYDASSGEFRFGDLPYPKFFYKDNIKKEDNDEDIVQFNRALLINGFRRLEALEIKREYEDGMRVLPNDKGTTCVSNPFKPSIFMSTLCSSRIIESNTNDVNNYNEFIPSDFHITCAKLSPNDGRRIAVGCEDSAIRIMSVDTNNNLCVLYGHKGYPIFDINWCRDGRTLLSAGGDGSVRLWDTLAIGPYAKNTITFKDSETKFKPPSVPSAPSITTSAPPTTSLPLPSTNLVDVNAAELAVYKSHSNVPIYSVTMAPCGYYFLSTASDGVSRLWLTDYPNKPFRLFLNNTSVHCSAWHPNCNYVFTGCNDGIVRMYDVHSGRCVRIFSGVNESITTIAVCPSGRYVAASSGTNIGMWDIASGKILNMNNTNGEIYTMAYSNCGTTLAAGGTDACVHLWDVRGDVNEYNSYKTKQTVLLDLQYTKRNLLMAVGKYVA